MHSRKVEGLIFEASTDPAITGLTVDAQFTGDNLYDAIRKLCDSKNVGFRIKLSDDNKFVFKLYAGADRSYDQFTNPYVIFSPKFENVINTNYLGIKEDFENSYFGCRRGGRSRSEDYNRGLCIWCRNRFESKGALYGC